MSLSSNDLSSLFSLLQNLDLPTPYFELRQLLMTFVQKQNEHLHKKTKKSIDINSFDDYVLKLLEQPKKHNYAFDIENPDENSSSYIIELQKAQRSFQRHGSLINMNKEERQQISGTKAGYVYFGSMNRQVQFREMIERGGKNIKNISGALDELPSTGDIDRENIERVLTRLNEIKYIGLAASTRLITMKRPDACLPITRISKPKAQRFLGKKIESVYDYMHLLDFIGKQPWNVSCNASKNKSFWPYRVALLDALFYEP